MKTLTKRHLVAMRRVKDGGDVWAPALAKLLREVEQMAPGLISIGRPQMFRGSGVGRMPYFGAILTDRGRAFTERKIKC